VTLEQVYRLQAAKCPPPPVRGVVVWSGAMERAGQTFTLCGSREGHYSTLHDATARVEQGASKRIGSGVR
jgi:hypothetical protein